MSLLASSIAFAGVGCGGSSEFKAAGYTIDVGDQAYYSYSGANACPTGGTGQLLLDYVDYDFLCDPHHQPDRSMSSAHVELQVIVTIGQPPDYAGHYPTMGPYQVGPADCKFGQGMAAIGQILHYPAGSTSPDRIVQADTGEVNITQFDASKAKPLKGNFTLHFGADTIKNTFSLDSCN